MAFCKYCNCDLSIFHHKSRGAHVRNCNENFNKNEINQKIRLKKSDPRITVKLICAHRNCQTIFEISLTQKQIDKGNYRIYCSRKCANSRVHSDKTKKAISEGVNRFNVTNSGRHNRTSKITKYNIDIFNLSFCYCGELKKYNRKYCSSRCHHNCPKKKENLSRIAKDRYKLFPEQHPNRRCAGIKESYPEKFFKEYFELNGLVENIDFIRQHHIGRYFVDFYIPKLNLVIEVDGEKWHKDLIKESIRDQFLNQYYEILHFSAMPLIKKEYQSIIDTIINEIQDVAQSAECQSSKLEVVGS